MKRIVNIKQNMIMNEPADISKAVEFIGNELKQLGTSEKYRQKTELLCEESLVMLMQNAPEGKGLRIRIRRLFGETGINLSMKGTEFDPLYSDSIEAPEEDGFSEEAIRSLLLRSLGEQFKYSYKNGINNIRILTGQAEKASHNHTIYALVFGLLFGFFVKMFLPLPAAQALMEYVLTPVQTIFMRCLTTVIAPVVFFSIVTCFSQFHSLADFGKLGAKVFGMYILTTLIAVCIGLTVSYVIRPGAWGFALAAEINPADITVNSDVDVNALSLLMNIIPSNFLAPFLESNTLQVIFLAVLCGTATGMIREYSSFLNKFFEAFNSLFLTITAMITKMIPVAAFCSVSRMVIRMGGSSLIEVVSGSLTVVVGIIGMLCSYGLLILLLGKLNPLVFFKKVREAMITAFTISSSSASMPTSLRVCTEKLGISPKVANFSIPLGATINMDGTTIFLTVTGLFLARAYGVEVPASSILSLIITVVLLSLGSPGVPGGAIVCLSVVLKALQVPVEAVGLVIAINPILDMCDTMSNVTGDIAAALIVSKSEGLLDMDVFQN